MDILRNRLAAELGASAVAFAPTACGDDDGKGVSEDVNKGAKKGAKKIKTDGKELEDDVTGKDEKRQKD